MSEEKSIQEKKKRLLPIVNCFKKGSTEKVSDLKNLLNSTSESGNKNASTDDESTIEKMTIPYVNALVVFTSDALPEEYGFLDDYCRYRGISTKARSIISAYQLIDSRSNNEYSEIKRVWKKHIAGQIQLNTTSLTDVLTYIISFANNQPRASTDFKSFLTNLQSGVFGVFTEGQMENKNKDTDAKEIISGAIDHSAKKCVVFTGAPGTGKTYCVEEYVVPKMEAAFKNSEYFVQFHSSYDYTDFMEGLRPVQKGDKMVFVRMDGIFKAFCRKIVDQKIEKPCYFVIDEINRADLGRVFGELMYCFEKRGKEHTIATQYANLPAYNRNGEPIIPDCFRDGFYIPENVVIVGTMNDIDRSVETFDFALRRRFDWVEIDANTVMASSLKSMKEGGKISGEITQDLVDRIKEMNEVIAGAKELGLSPAFAIGPAYFQGYDGTKKKLEEIWERNIEPILTEYVRGRQNAKEFVDECKEKLMPPEGEQE